MGSRRRETVLNSEPAEAEESRAVAISIYGMLESAKVSPRARVQGVGVLLSTLVTTLVDEDKRVHVAKALGEALLKDVRRVAADKRKEAKT